jgi:DNA-binding FadR family transcriptional regulator
VTSALQRFSLPYWDRYLTELIDVHANIDGYLTNYRRMHEAVLAADAESAEAVLRYHANWSVQLIRARVEKDNVHRPRRRS